MTLMEAYLDWQSWLIDTNCQCLPSSIEESDSRHDLYCLQTEIDAFGMICADLAGILQFIP